MESLDKGYKNIGARVESKEGERGPLSSNKANVRSPSLEFNNNSPLSYEEEQRVVGLFSILLDVDRRLHPETYKRLKDNSNEGDNLSEGIGQETGLE